MSSQALFGAISIGRVKMGTDWWAFCFARTTLVAVWPCLLIALGCMGFECRKIWQTRSLNMHWAFVPLWFATFALGLFLSAWRSLPSDGIGLHLWIGWLPAVLVLSAIWPISGRWVFALTTFQFLGLDMLISLYPELAEHEGINLALLKGYPWFEGIGGAGWNDMLLSMPLSTWALWFCFNHGLRVLSRPPSVDLA